MNLNLGCELKIKEDFILSESSPPPLYSPLVHFLERCFGLFLFLILLPLFIVMRVCRTAKSEEMVQLPASWDQEEWRTFTLTSFCGWLSRLPWLIQIVKGNLHLVGMPPRTLEETKSLPREWQRLYLKSKAGLISLADVEYKSAPTKDEQYAAESFYFVRKGFWFDLKTCFKWLTRMFSL